LAVNGQQLTRKDFYLLSTSWLWEVTAYNSQEGNKAMGRKAKQNCRRSTINLTVPFPEVTLMTFVYAGRT